MKITHITLPVLVLGAGASIGAAVAADESNKKPVTSWTCADFLAVDDQFRPKVVYVASAFTKGGKPEAAVIDIDGTEKVTPLVIDDCHKAPQSSFMQKLKGDWSKVKADAKVEAKKIDKKL
jgi:acid stress chaperone HdeA